MWIYTSTSPYAFSLMRTIEEILEWKSNGSGLENRD
jgi:hypothetical protein